MHYPAALVPLVLASLSTHALPTTQLLERGLTDGINVFDDVIVFDAAAFQDPTNPANTVAGLQSFVSLRQIDLGPLMSGIASALQSTLGLDIGNKISTVQARIKLFGAVGLSGKEVKVDVDGCNTQAVLPSTSGLPDPGMVLSNVSIGQCGTAKELTANVETSAIGSGQFNATIFTTPPDGFGVISGVCLLTGPGR